MALKCIPSSCAGEVTVPERYLRDCDPSEVASFCYKNIAVALCDYAPTSILNEAAITADVAAGKLHLLPVGKILVNAPTDVVTDDFDGCFNKVVDRTEFTVSYETWQVKTDHSHEDFWNKICKLFQSGRATLILIKSDGYMTLGTEWIDWIAGGQIGAQPNTYSIGLEASMTKNPYADRGDAKGKGRIKCEFTLSTNCMLRHELAPNLLAALNSGESV